MWCTPYQPCQFLRACWHVSLQTLTPYLLPHFPNDLNFLRGNLHRHSKQQETQRLRLWKLSAISSEDFNLVFKALILLSVPVGKNPQKNKTNQKLKNTLDRNEKMEKQSCPVLGFIKTKLKLNDKIKVYNCHSFLQKIFKNNIQSTLSRIRKLYPVLGFKICINLAQSYQR